MESMLGRRRRSKKEIPVLHWWFRNNHLFPSSSRTFRTQSYWSFITGQCCDSERILPKKIPYWMWIQSSFLSSIMEWYLEVRIRARDKRYSSCLMIFRTKVTRILTRLTWMYHVMHNTCTMHGKDIKTRYIGRHRSCDWKRIDILSDSIECNHPSRNTSSLLYSKSC